MESGSAANSVCILSPLRGARVRARRVAEDRGLVLGFELPHERSKTRGNGSRKRVVFALERVPERGEPRPPITSKHGPDGRSDRDGRPEERADPRTGAAAGGGAATVSPERSSDANTAGLAERIL